MIDATEELDRYLRRLFPLTRSITGEGNRQTLSILQELIPLQIKGYPTAQQVYDWTIPKEWHIRDAWIKNSRGEKIIDFTRSNLHVVSYSTPIHQTLTYRELLPHLHCLETLPDAIPYRTSYYHENWGFCLSHNDLQALFCEDESYEVCIDSELFAGELNVGELLIPGKSSKEYLLSCYICHPSMANDSLSGVLVTAFIARELLKRQEELEHSYRIVFVPETIGAIAYCANNESTMKKIKRGLVITTCGGPGQYGYKQSWDADDSINAMIEEVFTENGIDYITYPFDIHGSDERQYSSQGFRINCATISRDKYYAYDYYHTSLDDLDFVTASQLNRTLDLYLQLIAKMDKDLLYENLYPNCEVMLSKHDLYPKTGGAQLPGSNVSALDIILWLLFYCDGNMSLHEISRKLGAEITLVYNEAIQLEKKAIIGRKNPS